MKILKKLTRFAAIFAMAICASACHESPEFKNDNYGNFDALAQIISERYCFLGEKKIDWNRECQKHRSRINDKTGKVELFVIMSDLLDELKDGHVNLIAPFSTSYYRKWWSDYPQDFNLRTLQENYLQFKGFQTSGITYCIFNEEIGYMYYPSFTATVSEVSLDYIFTLLKDTKGLIIDIRNNGGGELTNIDTFVGRFISEEITGGYIRHKTGPGENEFSEPYPIHYKPAEESHVKYLDRPIYVLTNRSCFSAANAFVSVMKELPGVTIIGATTGGGGGLPFSSEIPNGWGIRFSASPLSDAKDQSIENGIPPTPGCEVHCTAEELAAGKDAILDFALSRLTSHIKTQK